MRWAPVTAAALDDATACLIAPDGLLIDGGLGPDSLAVAGGYVIVGPVRETSVPGVFTLDVSDETGLCLALAPVDNGPDPMEEDPTGPYYGMYREPAWGQIPALQTAIDYGMECAARKHPQDAYRPRKAVQELIDRDVDEDELGAINETIRLLEALTRRTTTNSGRR